MVVGGDASMETLLEAWDGETVIVAADRPTQSWIVIAIHSSRLGPATGGTRLKTYPDLTAAVADALRLAEGMTLKYAVAGFPRGGGKAVIAVESPLAPEARAGLLRRYGALIQSLHGLFATGPDVGTSAADMDVIAETGAPYVFSCTPALGGAGGSGPATALGVLSAIEATCRWLFGDASLGGRHVLVQGAGNAGAPLIDLLIEGGATVSVSEVDPDRERRFRDERGLRVVPPDQVYDTPCDIFAPCAMGGVLDAHTIPRLRSRAVVGAANNQLATPEDAERLRDRGILYAPDYAVNIGGAMAITGIEAMGWSVERAGTEVRRVGATLTRIFELAQAEGITPDAAARRLARARLAGA
jgi:leucine dehydrogenase